MKNKLHPFRKKWGQNFIADTNLLDRIVRTLELDKNNRILIQGDSYVETLTYYKGTYNLLKEFSKKNNVGFIFLLCISLPC